MQQTAGINPAARFPDRGKEPAMIRSLRLLFSLFALLAASENVSAAPVLTTNALTPAVRERIDALALKSAPERTAERSIDVAGDLTAWLIKNVTLTDEEERAAADAAHRAILRQRQARVRPTPKAIQQIFD